MSTSSNSPKVLEEAGSVLRLGGPLVGTYASALLVIAIETALLGHLGAEILAGYSLAVTVGTLLTFVASGVLSGSVPLMSSAYGAGLTNSFQALLTAGVRLAFLLSIPVCVLSIAVTEALPIVGVSAEIQSNARIYLYVTLFSIPALLLGTTVRAAMASAGNSKTPFQVTVFGILVNILLDWMLIDGQWGAPALGIFGCAVATICARFIQTILLIRLLSPEQRKCLKPSATSDRLLTIVRFGTPIAVQNLAEYGVIFAMTLMMASFGALDVAAHQVARQFTSISFMLVLGIGTAGSIRVAQYIGRNSLASSRISVMATLALGFAFMLCCTLVFFFCAEELAAVLSSDPSVIAIAAEFIRIAALFQLLDAAQGIATSCLRGAGDSQSPMRMHIAALGMVGLPIAYILAFHSSLGSVGIWFGLCAGLAVSATLLLLRLHRTFNFLPIPTSSQSATNL